jgi:hypothetical protein
MINKQKILKVIKSFLIFIVLLLSAHAKAQDFKLTASAGFSGYNHPFDGYFFSFDIGIPVVRSLEIVPTFSFYSNIKHDEFEFAWDTLNGTTHHLSSIESGELTGSFEIFIYINPFKWWKKEKINNTDFGIGVGFGLRTFSDYYYNVNNNTVTSMIVKAGITSSLSSKIYYNYHFKKTYVGVVIGALAINDEGTSIIAIQFGINIK